MINLSRWAMNETKVVQQQQNRLFIPDVSPRFAGYKITPCFGNVHVANNSSKILIVTAHRVLHELELENFNIRDDELAMQRHSSYGNQPYCQKYYQLSSSGRRMVGVYIKCDAGSDASLYRSSDWQSEPPTLSRARTTLKFADLSGASDQIQTIELHYLDSHSSFAYAHKVTFSPDLSMLRAGHCIFDLAAPGQPQLWFPESPLTRFRNEANPSISFSPCNGYLTYVEDNIDVTEDIPATFGLFRICRHAGNIERLSIVGLEGLIADVVGADFHPTLPLLMLTCMVHRKSDVTDLAELFRVIEIELEALRPVQMTLPEHDLDMAYL